MVRLDCVESIRYSLSLALNQTPVFSNGDRAFAAAEHHHHYEPFDVTQCMNVSTILVIEDEYNADIAT